MHGRRSARTPLTSHLRRLFAVHESAEARGLPIEALLEELEHRTAATRRVSRRRFLPGTRAAFTGAAYEDHWARDPRVLGAYSFYKIGQYANYGTIAAAPPGRVHFYGEHTSINNQGFLDGAVETGGRAARQIVAQR
ncbi:MAG: FAD-dependent oxidoreductase [Candidatus Dormibacteria bacterium]